MKHLEFLSQLLIGLALCLIAFQLFRFLPVAQRYVDSQTRIACANLYRKEFTEPDGRTVVSSPIDIEYDKCLVENGLE